MYLGTMFIMMQWLLKFCKMNYTTGNIIINFKRLSMSIMENLVDV